MLNLVRAGCLWALLVVAGPAVAAPRDADLIRQVDAFVRAEMQREKVPGVAVAIIRGDEVIAAKGYGEANVEHHVPVTRETVFQSGSVGKMFTAVAVMQQVEAGKLSLDDPIVKYFPGAPDSWRPITVRHLLTHTSGIPDYTPQDIDDRRDYSEDELAKLAYRLALEFTPGSRWNYSNTGYVLLGILVRKVSGRFYGDLLKETIFAPLAMNTARNINEEDIVPNRAAGYRLVDGKLKNQEWVSPTMNTTADGSLYLTLDDLIAWDRGLRSNAVLKPESWSQIYTPVTLSSGNRYPYGFGWFIDEAAGKPRYHHGGAWQGFKTYISRYLAADLTIIVLANLADAAPGRFVDSIARLYDPELAKPALAARPKAEPAVAKRLGTLLRIASEGKLQPEHIPFARQGFIGQAGPYYAELLRPLGPLQRLELIERRELGDDRVFTYDAVYRDRTMRVRFALAPGDRVSVFAIEGE